MVTMPAESSVKTKKQQWEDNYKEGLEFAKKYGHLNLPHKHADTTRRLSNWLLRRQRTRKDAHNYQREKLALLKDYGYKGDSHWSAQDETVWSAFFDKLMEYKRLESA
jgi:hypothetical protein